VAVALNIAPIAIGFDGGGSIRIPAAMSGIHGLATGFARLGFESQHQSSMIKAGPMTHSALDSALVFRVMAQQARLPGSFYNRLYDGDLAGTPPAHLWVEQESESNAGAAGGTQDLSDVRLGIYDEWFDDSAPAVRSLCRAAVRDLEVCFWLHVKMFDETFPFFACTVVLCLQSGRERVTVLTIHLFYPIFSTYFFFLSSTLPP
jgi:Asp-tRNA(Asn)/Glu-tRNA(Gln) amidotransferase A subunit family amidase